MAIYKIIEKNEEVPELSKIEKSDFAVNITLKDEMRAFEENKKGMANIEAEVRLKKALKINIEEHHPEVLNFDEKTQMMIHTYHEADRYIKLAEAKLEEFHKAQEELEAEINEIKLQTGINTNTVEEVVKAILDEEDNHN